jgi:hypothetical protein
LADIFQKGTPATTPATTPVPKAKKSLAFATTSQKKTPEELLAEEEMQEAAREKEQTEFVDIEAIQEEVIEDGTVELELDPEEKEEEKKEDLAPCDPEQEKKEDLAPCDPRAILIPCESIEVEPPNIVMIDLTTKQEIPHDRMEFRRALTEFGEALWINERSTRRRRTQVDTCVMVPLDNNLYQIIGWTPDGFGVVCHFDHPLQKWVPTADALVRITDGANQPSTSTETTTNDPPKPTQGEEPKEPEEREEPRVPKSSAKFPAKSSKTSKTWSAE